MRDEVFRLMGSHRDIMVYYHCFYILEEAISRQPEIFYAYWNSISQLLDHPNSYHRDFSLTLLAGLIKVDKELRFDQIKDKYLSLLNDQKFSTGLCCLRNLARIVSHRQDLLSNVVTLLLKHEKTTRYKPGQEALFNADVLILLGQNYSKLNVPPAVKVFIERQKTSKSPKTRRYAKVLIKELSVA